MAEFDIGILSKLQIDPKSSTTDINKIIKSDGFKKSIDAVAVAVVADDSKAGAFRDSVRKLTKDAFKDSKNQPTVKVGVEVNQTQAVKTINTALIEASKKLKSIKVDIDARVDKNKLKEQLRQPTAVSSTPITSASSAETTGIKQSKSAQDQLNASKREGQNITSRTSNLIRAVNGDLSQQAAQARVLEQSYSSVDNFVKAMVATSKKNSEQLSYQVTETTQLANGHKDVVIQLQRHNAELKKIESTNVKATLDETGKVTPKQVGITNAEASQNEKTRIAGINTIEKAIEANKKLIASSSPIKAQLEEQNIAYRKLQTSMELTNNKAKEMVASNNLMKLSATQQANAVKLQTKLQNDYAKAMQQNARHIDKGGMQGLIADIKKVDVTSNTALNSLKGHQAQMQGYVNQAAQATRSQMGILENFQNAMVKFPIWMGASTLFFGAIRSAKEFVTNIIEVDTKMTTLRKVMSDSADMNQVFEDATASAERFGQTLSSVLDAYAEFARQGYEGADLTNFADAALITSNVGEVSAAEASEFLTSAAAQWQQGSKDAMGNIDSWNNIANNYATTVAKLGEGHAKAGSTARAMGLDFDETNAVLGALTAQTKQSGSEIGNFIKAVFPRAYTVGRGTLEDLGIQIEDNMGRTKSAIELYREAAHAITDMNASDQAEVVKGLGGVHHYQRMQVLLDTLRETGGMYDQIHEASVNSAGSAAAENAIYMESLEAQINKAKVSIEMFSLALGDAFLEAGILEFVTVFTDSLTALTRIMTEFPNLSRIAFGGMIASLLMMNKTVRQSAFGFNSIRDALNGLKSNAAASSITSVGTSLNRLNQSQASLVKSSALMERNLRGAGQGALVYSGNTANLVNTQSTLADTQRRVTGASLGVASATQTATTRTQILGSVSKVTSGAVAGLGVAFRGLMMATGVGAVIAGITWAMEKFIGSSAKATQATTEFAQTQDVLKQSLEQDSEGVQKLVDDYMKLESAIQDGDYSNEQLVEHKDLTEQLTSLFPDLVAGAQEYGSTLSSQEGIMQGRIDLLKLQIQQETELAKIKSDSARQERIDAGLDAEKSLNRDGLIDNQLENARTDITGSGSIFSSGAPGAFQQQAKDIETINDLRKYGNDLIAERNRLQAEDPELHASTIADLDEAIAKYQKHNTEIGILESQVQQGLGARAEEFLMNTQELLMANTTLGDTTGVLMGRIANQIAGVAGESSEASNAYGAFLSKLGEDSGFVEQMSSYEAAVQSFKDASGTEEEAAAYEELVASFTELKASISETMASAGFDDAEIQTMVAALEAAEVAGIGFEGAVLDTHGAMVDLDVANEEVAGSTDEVTYAWQKASDAVGGFKDEINALDGELSTISSAMEQLTETGSLDPTKFAEVLEILPEFADHIGSADEMLQFLQSRYGELSEEQKRALGEMILTQQDANDITEEDAYDTEQNKLNYNADRVEGEQQNESDVVKSNAEKGLTDSENKDKVEKAKAVVTGARAVLEDEQEAGLVNAKGKHYEVDDSNFVKLGQNKEKTEEQTVESIGGMWSQLGSWVTGVWSGIVGWAKGMIKDIQIAFGKDVPETGAAFIGSIGSVDIANEIANAPAPDAGAFDATVSGVASLGLNLKDTNAEVQDLSSQLDELFAKNPDVTKSIDDQADAVRGLGSSGAGSGKSLKDFDKSAKGASDATKKAAKEAEKAKEKIKDLDVEVERLTKTFQKQTFILNQHEERLRKINHQIEKQNLQTERYATHSANYRKALQKENKLNSTKLKAMQAQEKSLANQIKRGRINEYGLVSEDVNVSYNNYKTSSSGSGSGIRKTGQVRAASSGGSGGKVSPFAGWKVNYGYSPSGGGRYGAQIGFNGGRHYGIDFGGRSGQAIRTPHGGQVVKAGWSPYGGGNQVEVYNKAMNKTFTFMHMLGVLAVKTGQQIQAGQQVGRMGSTGNSTGTHLHFQVNNGRGINNATSVNPNSYLSSGSGSVVAAAKTAVRQTNTSTGTTAQIGKSISEETASYLNEVEQTRLDAIEGAIKKHNAGEDNKSKVQAARESLDQMELERLQLVAQIREIEFKVIESQIEAYEVSKNKLNHRISGLEYKADNTARLAGKTSDSAEWRKWMNKAHTERQKQLSFQQGQVKYIENILKADSKKNPANRMNEAYRFQLEEQMRSGKEELVSLQRAVDESIAAILTSRTNQTFKDIDDALEKIDDKITLITHKRGFLDSTYQDGAGSYRASLTEEIKLLQSREDEYSKSLKTLKNLRSNLKQQPELYEQVNDKIKESEEGIRSVKTAIFELQKEGQKLELDKMFERLNNRLEDAQKKFDALQDRAHYINKESQQDLYYDNQADILIEMADYQKVIKNNITQLNSMEKKVKKFPELHKQVTDEIKNWEDQLKSTNQEMHTMRQEFASSFVDSVKQIYQVQRDEAIKSIDKELTEFEKMINKKIELIDKQHREETYQDDINDRQEELQKLRNEIAQRMGDNSLNNQKVLKDLQEELADKEKEYNKFISDKQREDRKDALNEELKDAQEAAEDQKESSNKAYDDLLNDQREFNKMEEEIMKGQIDKYKGLYKDLTDFIGENMKEVGKSVSEGLLDGINTPFEALKELTKIMGILNTGDIPVLESGLKPVKPSIDSPLADLIKGVDNNFTLNNLGLSPTIPSLNKQDASPSTTNNNNNNFNALLNIENFRGTKTENDKLLNSLIVELRKLGVTL